MLALIGVLVAFAAVMVVAGAVRMAAGAKRRAGPDYFSQKYRDYIKSPEWLRFRRRVLATTFGRDAVLPFLRASQVDHLRYRFGKEVPVFDVVPLHPATHRVVTALRDAGLRPIVDFVLRCAYGAWFVAYAAVPTLVLVAVSGHLGDLVRFVADVPTAFRSAVQTYHVVIDQLRNGRR